MVNIKFGINLNTIQRIIDETQAYPEGRIAFENLRTPLHIQREAEIHKYQMEIYGSYIKFEYQVRLGEKFKPFRGQNKQEIIINLLNRVVDMKLFETIGVIADIIYLHNASYYNKKTKSFKTGFSKYFNYLKNYLHEGRSLEYNDITFIKNYIGSKIGVYFAFMKFYD